MPSRKRNKGKERKAKKAEQELKMKEHEKEMDKMILRERWQGWARGEDMRDLDNGRVITQCNHGCDLMMLYYNKHPVTSFMDAFFMNCAEGKHVMDNLRYAFNTCPEVWNTDLYRKMTRDVMLGIGGNMFLLDNEANIDIAYAVMVLESYGGFGDIDSTINSRVVVTKIRDLGCNGSELWGGGSMRDVLKFYRKRLSCSCFKERHLHARKTLPKLGMCNSCGQKKDRSLLSVCSKCRVCQYCSRECQVADWHAHKGHCGILCNAHQRSGQNDYE